MRDQDPLDRFLDAQQPVFDQVIGELMRGQKQGHWMWFVFPQVKGLGESENCRLCGISGLQEAQAYIRHPILKSHLLEACHVLMMRKSRAIEDILGLVDAMKLQSSMTLFERATPDESIFTDIIDTFFAGERCSNTLNLI